MGYVLLKLFNKIFAICKVEGLAAAKKVEAGGGKGGAKVGVKDGVKLGGRAGVKGGLRLGD